MREQEDERIARQLYSQHTTKVAKQHEQLYNYDGSPLIFFLLI
jgi:hypothetical protein